MKTALTAEQHSARMRRWSDAKLDKELSFARLANEGDQWLAGCEAEAKRRQVALTTDAIVQSITKLVRP